MTGSRTGPKLWVPPRFGTPRNRDRASLGHQVGDVSLRLGQEPMPHQQHVWDVALELDSDGQFAYDDVFVTVMRQSGKTHIVKAKSTWRMTVAPHLSKPGGKKWGRQRSLYTAQRRTDARKKLEQDFAVTLREAKSSFREITNVRAKPSRAYEWKLSLTNGGEHIQFGRGNFFQIDAPSADVGHSDTLDDGNLDEIWALADDAVEQGVQPTMATRWNAQLWKLSTAGNEKSFYMWPIVREGRKRSCTCGARYLDDCSCGYEPQGRSAFFEWSIPDDVDIDDELAWWDYMPALGRTISPEFVRSQLDKARARPEDGGEDTWRRGYGNQWVRIPLIGGDKREAKLSVELWMSDACCVELDDVPVMNPGAVTLGFDVTPGGEWSSIGFGAGSQLHPYVELSHHEPSTAWLAPKIVELVRKWRPTKVAFDQTGPAGALADVVREALHDAGLRHDVVQPLTTPEYKAACGALHLAVLEGRLKRLKGQVPLDVAGSDAVAKPLGDAWIWDRKSSTVPISPLVCVTAAHAALPVGPVVRPPMFSYTT